MFFPGLVGGRKELLRFCLGLIGLRRFPVFLLIPALRVHVKDQLTKDPQNKDEHY